MKHRAFLKWAGGKYRLIEQIKNYLPLEDQLIEPFVGAGSVFLNTDYKSYLLADINPDLIHLYQCVKKKPNAFLRDARVLFHEKNNQLDAYYEFRKQFNQSTDKMERAILFLYLNRHGYNGLCRYNQLGEFNVPFGRYQKAYFPEKEILFFSEHAQKATFVCASYEKIMKKVKQGSVVYCDPPYYPLPNKLSFTQYHSAKFQLLEQQQLALLAKKLAQKSIPVLISNHDTQMTRSLYQDAIIHSVFTRRSISASATQRNNINEILALFTPTLAE